MGGEGEEDWEKVKREEGCAFLMSLYEEAWATALCISVGFVNLSDVTTECEGSLLTHGGNKVDSSPEGVQV